MPSEMLGSNYWDSIKNILISIGSPNLFTIVRNIGVSSHIQCRPLASAVMIYSQKHVILRMTISIVPIQSTIYTVAWRVFSSFVLLTVYLELRGSYTVLNKYDDDDDYD
jgi:hypothetical protein